MCCRCNRNRGCCRRNCRNRCGCQWTEDIPTRRILVNDLEALQNRAGGCGCCNCGCGCGCDRGRDRDCGCGRDRDRDNDCGCTREAERGCGCDRDRDRDNDCGRVTLIRNDDMEFANVFNNRCSCSCRD